MIKTLRRKFVFTSMCSLFILLLILISCATAIRYISIERSSDELLNRLSQENAPRDDMQERRLPFGGYQIDVDANMPVGYFIAELNSEGEILSVDVHGILADTEEQALEIAQVAAESGDTSGKISSYKYLITENAEDVRRIFFLDNAFQIRELRSFVIVSCTVALICMALMLVIVCMLSGRVIRPIAINIEKQQQFVTNAGHEIKTPLAIILSNTDAIELYLGENKWSGNIRTQVNRLNGLVKQMLVLARANEGDAHFPFDVVGLGALAENVTASFITAAQQKGVQIQTEIEKTLMCSGNGEALEQLLHILLDNAVKYVNKDGRIAVRLAKFGKKRLTVRNTCEALPDVPPETLFDRFYRGDAARTQKNGGYGIGLSVAQSIVEMHHGRIWAEYETNGEICFTVELP